MVWRKGLLIKLKEFGINGQMFDWIADLERSVSGEVRNPVNIRSLMPNSFNLIRRPFLQTMSNALSKSTKTASTYPLLC